MKLQLIAKETREVLEEFELTEEQFDRFGPFDEHGAPLKGSILFTSHAELRGGCLRVWLESAD